MAQIRELTGGQLDMWVARALAKESKVAAVYYGGAWVDGDGLCYLAPPGYRSGPDYRRTLFSPSIDGIHGQAVVERMDTFHKRRVAEELELAHPNPNFKWKAEAWGADDQYAYAFGPTLLVAAARCYVASVFGDTVPDNG